MWVRKGKQTMKFFKGMIIAMFITLIIGLAVTAIFAPAPLSTWIMSTALLAVLALVHFSKYI